MKQRFKHVRFHTKTLDMIYAAEDIINEYIAAGFVLTLRQLYYQFVSRDLLANTEANYNKLGKVLNDARMSGLIDWEAIEDRTRNLESLAHWENPKEGIESLTEQYRIDMWENQLNRVEVWIEKEALAGVIERVCIDSDCPFFACRGYVSQSEQWRAYRRIQERWRREGQGTVILHLGDHDPSGIDMTRDNLERLSLFLGEDADEALIIERIALNMDQIRKYNPPPNPAKVTDTRFREYRRKYGGESWELDALSPTVIEQLIQDSIEEYRDAGLWRQRIEQYATDIKQFDNILEGLEE